jgi:hypothetical protein
MVLARRPRFLLWFCIGLTLPLVLWGLGAGSELLLLPTLKSAFELVALGSCPFWLFLWVPAMAHSTSNILFYSAAAGVLLANGCLYLVMGKVQMLSAQWRLPLRLTAQVVAYPVLMALGYCIPLGFEVLANLGAEGHVT